MEGNRAYRRKHREKENSRKNKITKRDKIYAFLAIGGIFLAAVFLVLWFAFRNFSEIPSHDKGTEKEVAASKEEQLSIFEYSGW